MRTLLSLATLLLTTAASAQPVLHKAFDYQTGDSLHYIVCDTLNFIAGDTGANKVWQFSQLSKTGDTWIKIIPTTSATYPDSFPSADYVELYPDGSEIYRVNNANGYYVTGVANGMYVIKYPDAQLLFENPLGFTNTISDTFKSSYFAGVYTVLGAGTVQLNADAHGELMLPDTTYTSVLRVRMEMIQIDTLIGWPEPNLIISKTISYMWFDTAHKAALLKADSIKIETPFANTQRTSVVYLKEPHQLKMTIPDKVGIVFSCAIVNNDISLHGNFENGNKYTLYLYDISGSLRVREDFSTQGENYRMQLQKDLPVGMYVVTLLTNGVLPITQQVYKAE